MRYIVLLVFSLILIVSCDDGDVITASLDFDDLAVKTCGDLVFYKEKANPAETLSIQLGGTTLESLLIVNEETNTLQKTFAINGSTNRFNYRRYNNLPDDPFCSDIPNSQLNITNDDESSSGTVTTITTLIEDDDDGIPAEFEDINGNGNLEDDDTDGDGIPNYKDSDDDGDNVPTASEKVNYTDANGLANAQDSDNDSIPDYLDNDDDGDGILTRDEENFSQDNNPLNDISDVAIGADFLNPNVTSQVSATAYRQHSIKQTYTIEISVSGISLSNLIQDTLIFGTYSPAVITITMTPEFN